MRNYCKVYSFKKYNRLFFIVFILIAFLFIFSEASFAGTTINETTKSHDTRATAQVFTPSEGTAIVGRTNSECDVYKFVITKPTYIEWAVEADRNYYYMYLFDSTNNYDTILSINNKSEQDVLLPGTYYISTGSSNEYRYRIIIESLKVYNVDFNETVTTNNNCFMDANEITINQKYKDIVHSFYDGNEDDDYLVISNLSSGKYKLVATSNRVGEKTGALNISVYNKSKEKIHSMSVDNNKNSTVFFHRGGKVIFTLYSQFDTGCEYSFAVVKVPSKTSFTALSGGKKSFKAKFKNVSADKYQIQYSTSSSFKGAKTINTTKNSATIKKLKSKKKYYVRVRAAKNTCVGICYSDWSKSTVKTK